MSCLPPDTAAALAPARSGLDHNPFDLMQPRAPAATPKPLRNGGRVKENNVAPQGVYLPNYNILTPHMRSPEYVQMSTAAAITLGVMHTPKAAAPIALTAGSRAIVKRSATTPIGISSASTGRRCRSKER
jgi:hypothetical protein